MTNEEAIELIRIAQSEIEWDYPMEYAIAFDKAIEALEAAGWISVKDRLPEHGQTVLAWEASGFVYVDNYDGEHDIFKIACNNGGTVTHWQSLPEPPKEEEERQ